MLMSRSKGSEERRADQVSGDGELRMTAEEVVNRARDGGAENALTISPRNIFTGAWVRMKCMYGCGAYGSSLLCPPHSPRPEETRRVLDCYETAVLVQAGKGRDMRRLVGELEREAFLAGYYKAFGFASGPCPLCEECAFEEGCRHPRHARPAMEACGIDVFRTARTAGLPIEVAKDHECEVNFYGLLLLE